MFGQEDADDAPASVKLETESGGVYDLKNIPGKARLKLISEGEVDHNVFTTPDNMPGKKLKALRDAANARVEQELNTLSKGKENPFKVGDSVRYKNVISEVTEVDPKLGVKIIKGNGKESKWIHFSKVEMYEDTGED